MRTPPLTLALILLVVLAPEAGGTKLKPAIKPKPVRAALERRYAELRSAYFRRDSSAILSSRLPQMFSITASGDTLDPDAVRRYTRASFEQVERTVALDWDLGVIDVQGDTAAVELDQHWARRQLKGGVLRTIDTRAHQRETWIRKQRRWFLWRVDHVQPGVWRVDGKGVDPSKPYDPNAPEYRPPGR